MLNILHALCMILMIRIQAPIASGAGVPLRVRPLSLNVTGPKKTSLIYANIPVHIMVPISYSLWAIYTKSVFIEFSVGRVLHI